MNLVEALDKNDLLALSIGSLISADSNTTEEEVRENLCTLERLEKEFENASIEDKERFHSLTVKGIEILNNELAAYIEDEPDKCQVFSLACE